MMRLPAFVLVALMAIPLVARAQSTNTDPKKPNIVFFIADDMSIKDVSVYGEKIIPSPNMMALAKDGLVFDDAYAVSPTCAPSRAAMLTGMYGIHTGAMWNQQPPRPDVKKWPAYFKELGYEVVAIGKTAHYAQVTQYGFDYCAYYNYHQDICIDEAVKWLANRKSDKPLCFLVGTNFSHVPWPKKGELQPDVVTLPAKNADTPETREARTHYDAAVTRADSDLGEVREAVKKYLPADNTLFIFSADQGAQWPFAKWNLYEAGLHVPMIVSWPGHVEAGKRTSAMVSWIDIMPTLMEAAGGDPKTMAPNIDGKSFMEVLTGKAEQFRDRVFASHSGDGVINIWPSRSVRLGNWKYIRNLTPDGEFHTHIDRKPQDTNYFPSWTEHAKTDPKIAAIIDAYLHRPADELYDLSNDPDELKNLASDPAHASDLASCKAAMDEWMKANDDKGAASDEAMKRKIGAKEKGGEG